MSKAPLVSVIIPTYNRAHLIGETLDSVLVQTYTNWECIIVDDGSTDNTDEIVRAYVKKDSRFRYYHRPEEHLPGGNGARNYGFKMSKGEYINWFDSDDLMHLEKLSLQLESLKGVESNFSLCQTLNFRNDLTDLYGLRPIYDKADDPFEKYLREDFVVFTPSALWKKQFINENNHRFEESLKASQEWEFYCRVFFKEKKFAFTSKPLVFIRLHSKRISSKDPDKKFWNYFLARHMIYKTFDEQLTKVSKQYLLNYFLGVYKTLFRRRSLKKVFKIFIIVFSLSDFGNKQRVFLTLSFFSFLCFKRGDFLIKKITK